MWFVHEIYYDNTRVSSLRLRNIDVLAVLVLYNYKSKLTIRVEFEDDCIGLKSELLKYLEEKYNVMEIIGIGHEHIYEIDRYDSKILDTIDYCTTFDRRCINASCKRLVIWLDDDDNMLFCLDGETLILSRLIINYPDCYIIKDGILIILTDDIMLPCYKLLCSVDDFNRILAKIATLRRK